MQSQVSQGRGSNQVTRFRRTITIHYWKPWLLGWSRWSVETSLYKGHQHAHTDVLAQGRWRWRGRHAAPFIGIIECDAFWKGPTP